LLLHEFQVTQLVPRKIKYEMFTLVQIMRII